MSESQHVCDVTERLTNIITRFSLSDQLLLTRALTLSKKVHATQMRYEGVPHFIHTMRIAISLYELLEIQDAEILAAALLHDTVEDTDVTLDEIETTFNTRIATIVDALTRDKTQYTKQEKFSMTLNQPWEIRAVKVCDNLDNMRSWFTIPEGHVARLKLPKWMNEAREQYIPLARTVDEKIASLMEQELTEAEQKVK